MINISISTNMLIIISCIALAVIIGIIVYIILKDKKIDQDEINDLIDDIVKAKPRDDIKIETIKKEIIEPARPKIDLEQMLNVMQNDLEKKEKNKIETFEKDQEENAIISYKELLKAADKVEDYEKNQEENAIISYKELNKGKLNSLDLLEEKEKPVRKAISKIESPREKKDKKFKNTDFISPIYGKMDEHIEYPKIKAIDKNDDLSLNGYFGQDVKDYFTDRDIEKALNVGGLTDEMKKNDDFLRALKEFRNNL